MDAKMNAQLPLIIDQETNTAVTLFGDGVQVAGTHGQTQQRTYVEQVQYWSEFTVMWLWHNDRVRSPRSQERYWAVWLEFFGYDQDFSGMPFESDVEKARRIMNIIDAAPVKPWEVDARQANAYKVRLENKTHVTGRAERRGKRGKMLQKDTKQDTKLSANSIANAIAIMSSYYKKAGAYPIYQGGVEAMLYERNNPFAAVSRPEFKVMFKRDAMTDDQVNRVLGAIPINTIAGALHFAILTTYVLTGRRNTEVRNMKFGDVEMREDKVWYKWHGKHHVDGETHEMPLVAWQAIENYLRRSGRLETIQADDYLFIATSDRAMRLSSTPAGWRPGSEPISVSEVNRVLKVYLRKANIKGNFVIHSLRHTLARRLLDSGAGIEEVKETLGHANIATTLIYTEEKEHKLPEAMDRYEDQIGIHRLLQNRERMIE